MRLDQRQLTLYTLGFVALLLGVGFLLSLGDYLAYSVFDHASRKIMMTRMLAMGPATLVAEEWKPKGNGIFSRATGAGTSRVF